MWQTREAANCFLLSTGTSPGSAPSSPSQDPPLSALHTWFIISPTSTILIGFLLLSYLPALYMVLFKMSTWLPSATALTWRFYRTPLLLPGLHPGALQVRTGGPTTSAQSRPVGYYSCEPLPAQGGKFKQPRTLQS